MKITAPSAMPAVHPDLVVDWSPTLGLSGPGADAVRNLAAGLGEIVPCHPVGFDYTLRPGWETEKAAIAALVGYGWELPPDLASAYPTPDPDDLEDPDSVAF